MDARDGAGPDLIVEMRFGAHLYGTATPDSDTDIKGIYLPDAADILLQRVRPVLTSPPKPHGARNAPGDVDREIFSLQRYLALLAEGQTLAIDMLFAPDDAMLRPPGRWWREVQANASRFVSRGASSFVRYCRQQADRYGIKGSRLATARAALALLAETERGHGTTARLAAIAPALDSFVAAHAHAAIQDGRGPGGVTVRHLSVCGRKMPLTAAIKTARETVERLVAAYGPRTAQAERDDGIDWKALSHAVRVGHEALELLDTGRIVFPLRQADHIRRIKRGELPYREVAEEIEGLVAHVEAASASSSLPAAPDRAAMDDLVRRAYRSKILQSVPEGTDVR